jgi:hypothetical protein
VELVRVACYIVVQVTSYVETVSNTQERMVYEYRKVYKTLLHCLIAFCHD